MRYRLLGLFAVSILGASAIASAPPAPKPKSFLDYDDRAQALLGRMTLEEKVGQMTQADEDTLIEPSDIATYFLGSVLNGGDSDTGANRLEDWREMYDRCQSQALKTRLRIPLLHGVDAVHGHNNVRGAVVFPHNVGLGATRDPALVEEVSRVTAEEVRATGIHWTFAPAVTVSRDERWGRAYESFSEDPTLVAELGAAAVRGLQGASLADSRSVLACAKHYAGDGGTAMGTGQALSSDASRKGLDQGDTRVDEATLRKIHLPGYVTAIAAGVGTIMPSYSSWNGQKCSGSKRLLTEILKGELGFEGFLISDWIAIDQLPGDYKSDVRESINAGMDMVMVPHRYREFVATLKALVQEGAVPMSRIDDAVNRILRVKIAMGLLDEGRSPLADPAAARTFGSPEHRAVARRAVRQSLVVLKNDGKVLPLARTAARIHVAGKNAKDIGNQCGGWTVTWQGMSGALVPGTTILDAIRGAAGKTTRVSFTRDGKEAAGATVGVVVVGETPYAEMRGDREDLALAKEDLDAISTVKKAGVPVVTVVVSGRPLILGEALTLSDAIVAAWLPGTEGEGVADVLFGDHKPTGKLAFSWPRSMSQIPINVGDQPYDPLFPYGFGLTY
jgi:beta-glucosidase